MKVAMRFSLQIGTLMPSSAAISLQFGDNIEQEDLNGRGYTIFEGY